MRRILEILAASGIEGPFTPETPIDSLPFDSLDYLSLLADLDIEQVTKAAECQTLGELAALCA